MIAAAQNWFFRHFFQLLLAFVCLSQWVTGWWLLGGATLPAWVHVLAVVAIYAINVAAVRGPRRFGRRPQPTSLPVRLYFGAAFASVFCLVFLAAASLLFAVLGGIEAALAASTAQGALQPTSDSVVFRAFTYTGCAAIGLSFLWGYSIGQRQLRVREIDIPMRNLPPALEGVRIAQISDVHMGQNLDPEQLAGYVDRVNATEADLICVTGDMVDSPQADIDLFLPIFAGLRARCGVYAILGNHDFTSGAERVSAAIRRQTDFTLLRDEHVAVPIGDAVLHLVGLDDRGLDWARGLRHDPRLDEVWTHVPPGAPAILLNHRPDLFEHAARIGVPLTLSGHTHGGQIGMPWLTGRVWNPSRFITAFDRGLFEREGHYLYTNCGLGVTAQRVRIATPREISVFRLCRREEA